MKLKDAEQMATSLMRHYGIFDYRFSWMQRREKYHCAGYCDYKKKLIKLAPRFVELNYPLIVKWTILHEIAHAITGKKHGHNKFWKRTARLLGDDGNRCLGEYVKR